MHSPHGTGGTRIRYSERLVPSLPWWLCVPAIAGVAAIVFLPIGGMVAAVVAVPVAIGVAAGLWSLAAHVEVTGETFRAGRARIEHRYLGEVSVLDAEQVRGLMGPLSDARSHVLHRPWVRGAVRVEIVDPRDPCPFWLVSTRDPRGLAEALGASGR